MRGPQSFIADRSGATAPLIAAAIFALIAMAAICVDSGAVYLYSRKLQGAADLAAVSAASDIRSDTTDQSVATGTAQSVASRNMGPHVRAAVDFGTYSADPAIRPADRFVSNPTAPNAVRVVLRGEAPVFFSAMFLKRDFMSVRREATAARANLAAFSIGSRLMALDGGVANAVLSSLTGSEVRLTLSDYEALASAQVDVLKWNRALAQRLDLGAATYDDVLAARTDAETGLAAAADVIDGSDSRARAALMALSRASRNRRIERIGDLIDLGPVGAQDQAATGLKAKVSALGLATGVLEVANGGRQVHFALDADAGVAGTTVRLAIGERPNHSPWLAITSKGEPVIRTAQARLLAVARVSAPLGLGEVRLPLFVETAPAEAKLKSVVCGSQAAVTLQVRPGVGAASIADIDAAHFDDFKHELKLRPAVLVSAALAEVSGQARVQAGGDRWQEARFSRAEVEAASVKTVTTDDIARALTAHLVEDLELEVRLRGLAGVSLGRTAIQQAVAKALKDLAGPLDRQLNSISALTGVRLGQADVQVGGLRCGGGVLVG